MPLDDTIFFQTTATATQKGALDFSPSFTKDGIVISKSLMTINSVDSDPNSVSCAIKNLGLTIPSPNSGYYSCGTTMFFQPQSDSVGNSSGGMLIFANSAGTQGYVLNIKSSTLAGAQGQNEFQILKVKIDSSGKSIVSVVPDSQSITKSKNIIGIIEGESYKIDVNIKCETLKTTIVAYINGHRITATDSSAGNILPATSNMGLFASLGIVSFDYIYLKKITAAEYNTATIQNLYGNQFAGISAQIAYGDMWLSGINTLDVATTDVHVEEFGPVAREIRFVNQDYSTVPVQPKYMSTNLNDFVEILDSNLTAFNAKAYILNTSGTFIPLLSSTYSKVSAVANNIVRSSPVIYSDEEVSKYSTQEPITFESTWIQRPSDAKALAQWINTQCSTQQMTISMNAIINPKIKVGDIISIKYSRQGLDGTEKFLVNGLIQKFDRGLDTTIDARSISYQ